MDDGCTPNEYVSIFINLITMLTHDSFRLYMCKVIFSKLLICSETLRAESVVFVPGHGLLF